MDSLLSYPTSLEKIVGVDISRRTLAKAAKVSSTRKLLVNSHVWLIQNIFGTRVFLCNFSLLSRLKSSFYLLQLLHVKLNKLLDSKEQRSNIRSAALYDGSITKFDSQLHGFDIATCLEVLSLSLSLSPLTMILTNLPDIFA